MRNEFTLYFDKGMPKGTAQQKGECIRYKIVNGKKVPYVHHFKKAQVSAVRQEYEYKLKKFRPAEPSAMPICLVVIFCFDVKDRKLWGNRKPTRPDCSNLIKELEDAMTSVGFWLDDSQIVDLHVSKYYTEKAQILVSWEEVEP